jgi:glycosyltransferase involved in cell wall biosynthesis
MKVLAVTNIYPTALHPASGVFVLNQIESLRQLGIEIELLHINRLEQGRSMYWKLPKLLQGKIQQFHPDLIHCFYGGVMAYKTAHSRNGLPMVVSFCGSDLLGSRVNGLGLRSYLSMKSGVWTSHKVAGMADAIIVKSKNLYDALPANVDASRVYLIANGVDTTLFRPGNSELAREQLGWNEKQFHVLFINSNYAQVKRLKLAEDAVRLARANHIPVKLHPINNLPHSRMPLHLNAAHLLLLTSIFEGSPNIIKEAMACNTPILSVDVGDVRERLEGLISNWVVEKDATPEQLAQIISVAYKNGNLRSSARERVQNISLQQVASEIFKVYQSLVT